MVYNKHEWQDGELITADGLNRIETALSFEQNNVDIVVDSKYDDVSKTFYWVTKIPKKDHRGNNIKINHGFGNDEYGAQQQTASQFNALHPKSVFVMNGSPITNGNVIQDGVVLSSGTVVGKETLGIKSDGSLVSYPNGSDTQTMLNDGVVNAWAGFFTLIKDGAKYNFEDTAKQDTSTSSGYDYLNKPNPRQMIGSDDNYYYAISTDGRKLKSVGLTLDDCVRIGLSLNLNFLFNLDGGGSTATIAKGLRVNTILDNGGTSERNNCDFLYIEIPDYEGEFDKNSYKHSAQTVTNYVSTFYNIVDVDSGFLGVKTKQAYITLSSEFVTFDGPLQYRMVNGQLSMFGRILINSSISDTGIVHGDAHPIAENLDLGFNYGKPVIFNAITVGDGGIGSNIKIAYDGSSKKMYIYEAEDKLKKLILQFYTTLPAFN